MGLHYNDIYRSTVKHTEKVSLRHLYKENTHVFAYYIMTSIFLNDHQGFMLWCKKNNTRLLKFNTTPAMFKQFADYMSSAADCISLLNNIGEMGALNTKVNKSKNTELMTTTRMSIIHTI
jgi:hypothetical protein